MLSAPTAQTRFAAALLGLFAFAVRAEGAPLNFVVILADDLGYMDVGFNNPDTFYETPNLDELARGGMVFTDFYAASPVCSPTRASLFTGKNPARLGTTNFFTGRRSGRFEPADFIDALPAEETTLAAALKEAGYRTFFAGKWHLGGRGHAPEDFGFDINLGGGANAMPRSYFAPYRNIENLPSGPDGEFLTDRLAEECTAFLEEAAGGEEPFLLFFSLYQVHTPLQAPQELIDKYKRKAEALELGEEEALEPDRERQIWPDAGEPRSVRVRQDHAVYAAMVESLDAAVGEVLGRVDALNLRDSTAVLFLSDNGGLSTSEGHPTSNLPLRAGKGWIYEGGVRVPMVVRWPGVTAAGTRCDVPAVTMDVYPTLLEMAGLPPRPDQHLDGVSLEPLLRNPFVKFDRDPVFFHYPHYSNQGGFPASAVRLGEYKLIQDLEDGAYELYHLPTDIKEHNNVEQLEGRVLEELSQALDDWRREVEAAPLRPNAQTGEAPPALW